MTLYETTFIMDPQLLEEGWEKAVAKYSDIIARGGVIKRTERWGLRRLAYPIKKRTQGYYVHVVHESAPSVPREMERQFLLDESCLRYLTVVADNPRYLEETDKRRATRDESGVAAEGIEPRGGPEAFREVTGTVDVSDFSEADAGDVVAEE